jgi:putative flippase GtrA
MGKLAAMQGAPSETQESFPVRPGFLVSFSRSQVTAFLATVVDFGMVFGLVEIVKVWYVAATAIGAFSGAVTNFLLNRHWSFNAAHRGWGGQAFRYALVSGGSLALNTAGVYAVTDGLGLHYAASVILVSLFIGFAYNYPLQRYFVFTHGQEKKP